MKRRYKKLRELQAAFKKKKKKQTSLHIIVKPLKNTDKEKIMKEGGKKRHRLITYKGTNYSWLLIRNHEEQKTKQWYLKRSKVRAVNSILNENMLLKLKYIQIFLANIVYRTPWGQTTLLKRTIISFSERKKYNTR